MAERNAIRDAVQLTETIGRQCFARGCAVTREGSYIMCTPHWSMVPSAVQRHVIRTVGAYLSEPSDPKKVAMRQACNAARTCAEAEEDKRELAAREEARVKR